MGDYDLVPEVFKGLGGKEIFHRVRIKPGKPLLFGKIKNTLVFGVPGNPSSSFLAYYIFIRPALYKMMGRQSCVPRFEEGILGRTFKHKTSRKHFVLVKISKKGSATYLFPVSCHGSADILALSKADGFMVVDENVPVVRAGKKMRFLTWKQRND